MNNLETVEEWELFVRKSDDWLVEENDTSESLIFLKEITEFGIKFFNLFLTLRLSNNYFTNACPTKLIGFEENFNALKMFQ